MSYAMCEDCGREMQPGAGCLVERVQIDGVGYPRKRYQLKHVTDPTHTCPDCGVWDGQYHHTPCLQEQCPICDERFIAAECRHVPVFTPYRPVVQITASQAEDWHKTQLPIVGADKQGTPFLHMVKAWRYRNSVVAIRKTHGYGVAGLPPRKWVVFYIPSGLGLASADTRADAEAIAVAMEPILTPLTRQVTQAVEQVRAECARRKAGV